MFLFVVFYLLFVWLWTGWRKFLSLPAVFACLFLPGVPAWMRLASLFIGNFALPAFIKWLEGDPIR